MTDTALAAAIGGGPDHTPLRTLARSRPVVVTPETSLRETLYRIGQDREDAAIVVDAESGVPLGLVTLRDLLHAIGMEGGGLDDPVAAHMLGAPLTISADAPAYRARPLMTRRGISHLVLTEADGRLHGLVSQVDLLRMRADGAEALIADIQSARDIVAMTRAADAARQRGIALFQSGMSVETLCQWRSGINDFITIRIIELIENEFDLPAVPWCWLALGAEGRLEPTVQGTQQNGFLFVPPAAELADTLRAAFLPFVQAVNQALSHCGFARDLDQRLAGNPDWCLSADEWRARFSAWLGADDSAALSRYAGCFDLRPLHGYHEFADRLRADVLREALEQPRFFQTLARPLQRTAPPLNWAGGFVYDRNRAYPHTIDLRSGGADYFTGAARLWALQHGVRSTGTADRLRLTGAILNRPASETAAEIEAFHLIQRFRMQQQLRTADPEGADRVNPADLNPLHRLMLKEALRQARNVQLRLRTAGGR